MYCYIYSEVPPAFSPKFLLLLWSPSLQLLLRIACERMFAAKNRVTCQEADIEQLLTAANRWHAAGTLTAVVMTTVGGSRSRIRIERWRIIITFTHDLTSCCRATS
jgi:hypothetical protein